MYKQVLLFNLAFCFPRFYGTANVNAVYVYSFSVNVI